VAKSVDTINFSITFFTTRSAWSSGDFAFHHKIIAAVLGALFVGRAKAESFFKAFLYVT
jgi:hypothetical protein